MNGPWIEKIHPAPSPEQAFERLAVLPHTLFLDSAATDPEYGRFSYITASPFELVRARRGIATLWRAADSHGGSSKYVEVALQKDLVNEPLRLLEERLLEYQLHEVAGLPPFQGGAAGLFAYGLSRSLEVLPAPQWDEFALPDLVVGLYDWVLAFDHATGSCHLISQGIPAATVASREARARHRAGTIINLLTRARSEGHENAWTRRLLPELPISALAPAFLVDGSEAHWSNFSHEAYVETVAQAIEYIRAGDVFQVNLSQRFLCPDRWTPIELYRRLRRANPASFAGYFHTGNEVVASSSPEQFLSLASGEVVTRPIKGTRRRGYTPEADAFGRQALKESEKDKAENVMIVDLLRNDISRVCKPHSVTVPKLFELEGHPTVHHLVSEVRGRLRSGLRALDVLRATFPGGSITGAPKVRSMEIIAELEGVARGPYCGSLGWIGFHGDMQLNILIRTMTVSRGWVQFPAGGGIVAASSPELEYQETLAKAEGMARALG